MIITAFKGGLGNQLFQYAAARKFAYAGQTELKLDFRNYAKVMHELKIRCFNIEENVATEQECDRLTRKDVLYYLEKTLPYYKRRFVWERNWMFDQNLVGIKRKNMYVRGTFQSPKYFDGIETILRKELTPKESVDKKYRDIIDVINGTNSVSIHIRRGDMMAESTGRHVVTPSYYTSAVEYIKQRVKDPRFFVFSDDIPWVKENLAFTEHMEFVSRPGIHDYEELLIMAKCKSNIIGDSTFSWWGAWLDTNLDKIVICPEKWLTDPEMNAAYTQNLLPESWVRL